MTVNGQALLSVEDLRVEFATKRGPALAVAGAELSIAAGEVLGVVGESGCGKSVTARAVMRLVDAPGRIAAGSIRLDGFDVLGASRRELQRLRGEQVSMIFQDPGMALNPVLRIGDQIAEIFNQHTSLDRATVRSRSVELLEMVGIPAPRQRLRQYPHQLSGGMQQRVAIAIALALQPRLLLADEPTTALDVTVQAAVLDVMRRLQRQQGMAMMLISHDIGVIAQMSDRVAVMYAGQVIEQGSARDVIERPAHPYTVGLIEAVPRLGDARGARLRTISGGVPDIVAPPAGCRFHPRCPQAMAICSQVAPPTISLGDGHAVACHRFDPQAGGGAGAPAAAAASAAAVVPSVRATAATAEALAPAAPAAGPAHDLPAGEPLLVVDRLVKQFPAGWSREGASLRRRRTRAVNGVSFTVAAGEAFALVGESGCGKSTTARMVMRLEEPSDGTVTLGGEDLWAMSSARLFEQRRLLQTVFQNPYASLNPRWTVEQLIAEPLAIHGEGSEAERAARVGELLEAVALSAVHRNRHPHQLSGGQRQRVAIARALALEPRLLVADEPVSALDVSVQAQILNLLVELKERLNLSLLFISHNLAVVQHLCERVAVMYAGSIVETGETEAVLGAPRHPYTQVLVSSVLDPTVEPDRERIVPTGEPPSPLELSQGCPFSSRCPHVQPLCREQAPPTVELADGRSTTCHLIAAGEL